MPKKTLGLSLPAFVKRVILQLAPPTAALDESERAREPAPDAAGPLGGRAEPKAAIPPVEDEGAERAEARGRERRWQAGDQARRRLGGDVEVSGRVPSGVGG